MATGPQPAAAAPAPREEMATSSANASVPSSRRRSASSSAGERRGITAPSAPRRCPGDCTPHGGGPRRRRARCGPPRAPQDPGRAVMWAAMQDGRQCEKARVEYATEGHSLASEASARSPVSIRFPGVPFFSPDLICNFFAAQLEAATRASKRKLRLKNVRGACPSTCMPCPPRFGSVGPFLCSPPRCLGSPAPHAALRRLAAACPRCEIKAQQACRALAG